MTTYILIGLPLIGSCFESFAGDIINQDESGFTHIVTINKEYTLAGQFSGTIDLPYGWNPASKNFSNSPIKRKSKYNPVKKYWN